MIQQAAVFVDAGYFYGQGSALLVGPGHGRLRDDFRIRPGELLNEIDDLLDRRCSRCRLLRIYWYDAPPAQGRLSPDQHTLSFWDDVKLRRGSLNSQGHQKGVDSLIVTDLIELARNGAISDAVILSGDGDLVVGLQIAQSQGVRIHLLGLGPEANQAMVSPLLAQEADTRTTWTAEVVERLLTVRPDQAAREEGVAADGDDGPPPASFEELTARLAGELSEQEVGWLVDQWSRHPQIPPDLDRRLLSQSGYMLGRDISYDEKKALRAAFKQAVAARWSRPAAPNAPAEPEPVAAED